MRDGYLRVYLNPEEIPKEWVNILPSLPEKIPPPLNPKTNEIITENDLSTLFPIECIRQENNYETTRIKIPEELRESYVTINRPTPLVRAIRLEKYLKTPAKIFYKREDVTPTGSHKPNTAIAQAYYAQKEGIETLTTETGAGQWGSALSLAGAIFNLNIIVFMTRSSYIQKPYRKILMELFSAEVYPSPSNITNIGKKFLQENPQHPGSLGIAISEAIETAISKESTKYALGSVLNFVLLHQTIIGLEAKKQLEKIDLYPDIIIGCVGGGSNFGGIALPFIEDFLKKRTSTEFLAVEPKVVPSLTEGKYRYDYGDTGKLTPLLKMYTLGHDYIPPPIHAGGLRYHGAAPIISLLKKHNIVKSVAYSQKEVFSAAQIFAKTEGIIPAPETAHAIKATIDAALKAKKENKEKVILVNFSGHGYFDMQAYKDFLEGKLQ